MLGEIRGLAVLDAACGEGYLARILAATGAHVTGIDLAPRLIALARAKPAATPITYRVADLSAPLPDLAGHFDRAISYLALNDIADYQGFSRSARRAAQAGRAAGACYEQPLFVYCPQPCARLFQLGHRLLRIAAWPPRASRSISINARWKSTWPRFLGAGLTLERLVDVPTPEWMLNRPPLDKLLPPGYQFPYFMILSFRKP